MAFLVSERVHPHARRVGCLPYAEGGIEPCVFQAVSAMAVQSPGPLASSFKNPASLIKKPAVAVAPAKSARKLAPS
jgi:hypothetical protein